MPLTLPSSLLMLPHPRCPQSIRSCSALKIYLLCCPQPSLCLLPPTSSSLPITILMLLQFPPNMPLMLLPHRPKPQFHLPSLHSCNALTMILKRPPSQPSPLLMLLHPCLIFSATYNPYTPAVPSRYASGAALNPPYAQSSLCCLPCLCSGIRTIGYGGLLAYMMNTITETC
ncbi:hypothetical protein O181_021878 [Austropuccinia psidii MF-1]|uniref:Uncharacterized protein n=1 Tax=Austropuccinia psidii MF-1 TaxID=1389203 RepID=A0A9Q3CE57_9BASI|nr:hypothetical protein [Austropuccinia psidii MF-1]